MEKLIRRRSWRIVSAVLALGLIAGACGSDGDDDSSSSASSSAAVATTATTAASSDSDGLAGTSVTVFGPESSDEEAGALQDALDVFAAESGIEITYTGNRDAADMINTQVAGGNPPDIFVFPQPGKLADFARDGSVLPLPADVVSSMEWSDAWTSFGNVDGTQYGVPSKSDLKSLVWYKPAKFAEKGYEIPGSWDALKSLAGDMIANGDTPFCVGIESGPATGWTFTDWIEDLMLRMHGADLYDEWVAGTLAFSSPEVSGVFEEVLELWNTPGMVYASGGSIAATPFGDNGQPLVDDDCMMHRQASFYAAFIPEGTAFADGSPDAVDTFYFPSVKGDYPVLGAGTLVGAFRDAPEVWEVMKYFGSAAYAETRQIAQTERKGGGLSGFLSGASGQDPSVYQPLEQSFLNILVSADVVRFDASDLMPAAVGAGTFWTDGTAVVNGDKTVAEATADIDASWPGAAPASSGSSLGDGSLGTVEVGAGEDIQIRSLHAISGDVAFLGVPMSRAVDMAVADYGDIHGFSVNAGTWLDDLCSSDGGQAAAQTIVADESVIGVLGTSCSGAATAAAPLITGAGMVLISGSNTSPALTSDLAGTAGDNWSEGYYRTAHNDLYQGAAAAKFAYEVLGAASAATIHDGDPYTEGLATAFANSFSDLGGDLQTITAVNKGDTDMVPVLTEVAAGSPDLLFFPIFPPEGNFISQQIGEVAGLENTTLMAADGMLVDNYMEIPESEGVFMSGPDLDFEGNANDATGQTGDGFLAAYEAEHGEAPSAAFWAHAYDATTLLLSAIEAASSTDGDDLVVDRAGVREFMAGVSSWPGIIGDISCDDFGDCGSQRIAVVQHNDSSDIAAGKNNVVFTYAPGGSATAGAIAAASGGSSATDFDAFDANGDGSITIGVAAAGPADDGAYYQAVVDAAILLSEENGFNSPIVIDEIKPADSAIELTNLADQGVDIIIVGASEIAEPLTDLTEEYPDIFWYCNCGAGFPEMPGLAQSLDDGSEVGFTAGYAAGLLLEDTDSSTAAMIGCCDLNFEKEFQLSFEMGIKAVSADNSVTYVPTGDWPYDFDNVPNASEAFNNVVADGAGVILPYLGGAHEAVVQLSNESGVPVLSAGASDVCTRPGDLTWDVAVRFDGGDYVAAIFPLIFSGEVEEGQTKVFKVGIDPEPGAVICNATDSQQAAMDSMYADVATGMYAGDFGAIKGQAYGGG